MAECGAEGGDGSVGVDVLLGEKNASSAILTIDLLREL
jgi:hypothetical protein